MATDLFCKCYGQTIQLSRYFGLPFTFNFKTKRVSVTDFLQGNTILLHLFLVAELIFVLFQTIRFKMMGDYTHLNFIIPILYGIIWLFVSLFPVAYRPHELAYLFNFLFEFFACLDHRYLTRQERRELNKDFDAYWIWIYAFTKYLRMAFPCIILLHFVLVPTNPVHIISIFPKNSPLFVIFFVPYAISVTYGACFVVFVIQVLLIAGMFGVIRLHQIFRGIQFKSRENNFLAGLRTSTSLPIVWRSIELLMRLQGEVVGVFLLPAQAILGKFIIVATYLIVSNGSARKSELDTVSVVVLAGFIVLVGVTWVVFLIYAGTIHKCSRKCMVTWRNARWEGRFEGKYFKMFKKSCKPILFGYPGYFEVRSISVVNFVQGTIKGIFRALLTLDGK
ncbi:hypothetical protein Fcan01_24181 [Folsomia candida]|uniref:Uncharacterized protein n=1 Tax=Folsomia candida TaxID=158441 RepID=A0A226D8U7_FOLCA|nr:hypothetical protein Fcan01_24181 [Folsomia candida]